MSEVLGYVLREVRGDAPEGSHLIECRGVLHVIDQTPTEGHRKRLEKLQRCYRAFEAFLPYVPGAEKLPQPRVLALLDRIARHGQLSISIAPPDVSPPRCAPNGRAYLAARRARRQAKETWCETTSAALDVLVDYLPFKDRQLSFRDTGLTVDLLIPSHLEPELPGRIEPAIRAVQKAAPGARFAVSGLWAPMSFAATGFCQHE